MYKALNYWVFGGFGPNKTPYEFIDFAKAKGLDGVELTVGDCLSIDIDEAECREIAAYAKREGVGLRTLATGCYGALNLRRTKRSVSGLSHSPGSIFRLRPGSARGRFS